MASNSSEDFYSIADRDAQQTYVEVRRAEKWVPFLLPHLRPSMTLLDCGCGVGSITIDLAEHVAPGTVIGVDTDEQQLQIARAHAAERGLTNVTFEQGNAYALRFDEASFDVVLAHTLLIHLSDPPRALRAFRRVVRPGGIVAVSDDDLAMVTFSPDEPLLRKLFDLWIRIMQHNGSSPFYSRHLRHLMLQAGFARTEGFALAPDHYGTLAETRRFASIFKGLLRNPKLVDIVTDQGWASQGEIDTMLVGVEQWAERPDAFFAGMYCAALGWAE
jgi:ubiquinone/menaquinone biosynthesis C-methylase UbiE